MIIDMKLTQTKDYLLLVDEEAEIKYNTIIFESDTRLINVVGKGYVHNKTDFKIIAYYPLTKEAKELDLPLLPPFEDMNYDELEIKYYQELEEKRLAAINFKGQVAGRHPDNLSSHEIHAKVSGFIEGYKAAQSKGQYSLEDMIGFVKYYILKQVIPYELDVISGKITDEQKIQMLQSDIDYNWNKLAQEYIKSLSTQQLPKEFIPVYQEDWRYNIDEGVEELYDTDDLKTITNSKGKKELVGTYKY